MRGLITIALLLIVGQATAEGLPFNVIVFHDAERGATCWLYSGINKGGISCLPDSLLQQATPSSEVGRASPSSSTLENTPLQATPLPQDQRFQL